MTSVKRCAAGAIASIRLLSWVASALLLLGIADSVAGSYLVLFASDQARLGAVQLGVFVSAPAAGSIIASFVAGRRFDRRPSRLYAAVADLAGAAGYAALLLTHSFTVMLIIGVVLLGAVGAAFPQLFALARLRLAGSLVEDRAALLLRSGWSLAWAVGPLIGALIVAHGDLNVVLAVAAAVLVATSLVTLGIPAAPSSAHSRDESGAPAAGSVPRRCVLALLAASAALFFTAMYAGSVALPLYVTRTLDRPASDIGLLYSACAIVEVLAAVGLALVPARVSQKLLIVASMVVFAGYFALTISGRFELVVTGQFARGIGIAVVGAAGIRYFQDLNRASLGGATTLFANASTTGSLIAGVLAGISNRYLGYTGTLALCGAAAVLAASLFATVRPKASTPTHSSPAVPPNRA